jgi:hypothetical protein
MANAYHLGPWIIGTVKNTTGTSPDTVRNMGATVVTQSKAINFNDPAGTVAFVIPAGSFILDLFITTITAFNNSSVLTVRNNSNTLLTSFAINVVGANYQYNSNTVFPFWFSSSATYNYLVNTGRTDTSINYTLSNAPTTGSGTMIIMYGVRNIDGTY